MTTTGARQPVKLVRVVRDEEGRPRHRGRIHVVRSIDYKLEEMVDTLCGLKMWVVRAEQWDKDNLQLCIICHKVPTVERLAMKLLGR